MIRVVVKETAIVLAFFAAIAAGNAYLLKVRPVAEFEVLAFIMACTFACGALFGAASILDQIRERQARKTETTPLIPVQDV